MEFRRTESGFRVVDSVSTCLRIGTDEWHETDDVPSVESVLRDRVQGPDDPNLTVSGVTERIVLPYVLLWFLDIDDDSIEKFSATDHPGELPERRYLLKAESQIRAFARFDGRPEVRKIDREQVEVQFSEPTAVDFAFESSVTSPEEVHHVERSVEGVAAGVSTFGRDLDLTSADRSWPSVRDPPPLLRLRDETASPAGGTTPNGQSSGGSDGGIELRVPRSLGYVLAGAPLVYYLDATVTVDDGCEPRLDLDGRTLSLGPSSPLATHESVTDAETLAAFASRCSALLRRTVLSDCLVRSAGPYADDVIGVDAETDLELDSERLYDAPIARRVGRYLDTPFESVSDRLPDWTFALSVDPAYETVSTISRVAHTLPAVAPATGRVISSRQAATDTQGDSPALRADGRGTRPEATQSSDTADHSSGVTRHERVRPDHVWGAVHGWLADGIPVEGFDALASGFENCDRLCETTADTPTVTVVLNGTDDHDELARAVEHYRRRTARLGLDVSITTDLSVAELARTFERETDLLHFVGHREDGGLQCPDGYFCPNTLTASNARTFFLNACESHPTGVTLVEKGSVAGGVTTRDVIDEMAAEVGVTMARLLADGFTVADAMSEARKVAMVPSDYLAVGDGTHVVTQSGFLGSKRLTLSPVDGDGQTAERFRLSYKVNSPEHVGADHVSDLDGGEPGRHLFGTKREYELSRTDLREFFPETGVPIWYDGELLANDLILDRLCD